MAAFAALLVVFAVQVYYVLTLRLQYGDVYPYYSSYRADPMGGQAFYEALASLPGVNVRRNEEDITRMQRGENTTLVLAGVLDTDDPKEVIDAIGGFVLTGGRLVVTYVPMSGEYWQKKDEREKGRKQKEKEEAEKKTREERKEGEGEEERFVNIQERWGFNLDGKWLPHETEESLGSTWVTRKVPVDDLPAKLLWRSPTYFEKLADYWKVIYTREESPVIIERAWGKGSIVIASDSYFLSNEAMRKHRETGFLTWLIGPNPQIIFDESHNGISRNPGMIDMMARYRLHLVLVSLVLIALLFVWKNALSLVPRHGAAYEEQAVGEETRKEALAGLNNLVRRSVPASRLLEECYLAWRQDFARDRRYASAKQNAVEAVVHDTSSAAPSLVARYRLICKLLKERT